MKRIFLISSLLVWSVFIFAYTPMLELNKKWVYLSYLHDTNDYHYTTVDFQLMYDSIIDGVSYYVGMHYNDSCLLREDCLAERVYVREINDSVDHLLYDFSLQIGDSAQIFHKDFEYDPQSAQTPSDSLYGKIYITSIDTIVDLVGNTLRKFEFRFAFPGRDSIGYYVESYGSIYNNLVLYNSYKEPNTFPSYFLRCVINSDETVIYHGNDHEELFQDGDCYTLVSVDNTVVAKPVVFYSDGLLHIDDCEFLSQLSIFSIDGKLVYTVQSLCGEQIFQINLLPGSYLVSLTNEIGTTTEKIIVSH